MAKLDFKVTVTGLQDAIESLREFSRTTRNRILRKACAKAAQPLVKIAKQHAPRESGLLRKSIGYVVRTSKRKGAVSFYLGPRSDWARSVTFRRNDTGKSRTMKRDPRFYKHLIEKGTGHSGPKPFMKPTWNQGKNTARSIIISTVTAEIAAYRAKKAAKGG